MKKLLLAGMLLFNLVIFAQSQKWEPAEEITEKSTTDKEYNYLTRGLSIQESSGLDIIAGYRLTPCIINRTFDNKHIFNVSYLVDTKSNLLKGISVVINSKMYSNKIYLCIPIKNGKLMLQHQKIIASLISPVSTYYSFVMEECFATLAVPQGY
ncbi:hypothetical protein ACM55F_10165 [Flavobacterium sp. XS2P12]|uniref:hypothetical protein n=1 Tax=Flavobacterium melibiosi TaxID=3398734 RepID=UPI003A8B0B07